MVLWGIEGLLEGLLVVFIAPTCRAEEGDNTSSPNGVNSLAETDGVNSLAEGFN